MNNLANELLKLPRPNRKKILEILNEAFIKGRHYERTIGYKRMTINRKTPNKASL